VKRDGDPGSRIDFISTVLLCSASVICNMLLLAARNIHIAEFAGLFLQGQEI